MSYHVRNPYQEALRQQAQDQRDLQLIQTGQQGEPTEQSSGWTFINDNTQKRVTDFSEDKETYSNDESNNSKVVQYDKPAFKTTDPYQPIVTYSTRKPNYPTGYSCEHSLLSDRNGHDEDVANAVDMLSYSEDIRDGVSIALNDTPVRLLLEVEIPIDNPEDYDEIISNVEALQWSLLNKISATSGLSKGCKIENQYDERTLVTALTNINQMHPTVIERSGTSNDSSPSENSINSNNRHSNSRKKNRRRTRELRKHRSLLATLPYPTSVYSISSTRPKWTASCSIKAMEGKKTTSKCFTTEINFEVKYRGSTGESNLIEEYIQFIIHNQLALDAKQLFAEDITGMKWISNNEASSVFNPSDSDTGTLTPVFFGPDFSLEEEGDVMGVSNISTPIKEQSNNFFASFMIPIATVIILGAFWRCFHMYHVKKGKNLQNEKERKQKRIEGPTGSHEKKDIETGSTVTGGTRDLISKSSSDTLDSQKEKSRTDVMTKVIEALHCTASSTPSKSRTRKSCPISVDSPERSAAGLPPRPLTAKRAVSKQLKKKRRKKKKSKKQVLALTRINSRNNIVEMPIISESESECDSEYTSGDEEYCDDGSSYDASSGCLTPTRTSATGSRTSSRAGSPQKSPRDDLFISAEPADPPGFDFVLEAPEFSNDSFVKVDKEQIAVVDENLPPNLALRPRVTDKLKPCLADGGEPKKNRQSLEIDSSMELNSSFLKENGTVMERMLPLPWLVKKPSI